MTYADIILSVIRDHPSIQRSELSVLSGIDTEHIRKIVIRLEKYKVIRCEMCDNINRKYCSLKRVPSYFTIEKINEEIIK